MVKTVLKYLPYGAALVVMLVSCYVQGMWSERWGTFPELKILSDQLVEVPMSFGEWEGTDGQKSDEKVLKIAGAEGELVRVYKNPSGQQVQVSIICARFRDVFYHTPERCYPAAGFEMQSDPQPVVFDIGNTTAEFFTTSFTKSEPTGSHTERGFWSWSADGTWSAPRDYKVKFAGRRALYKLYVFAAVPPGGKRNDEFVNDFIRAFIPPLEQSLRPAFEKAGVVSKSEAVAEAPAAKPAA